MLAMIMRQKTMTEWKSLLPALCILFFTFAALIWIGRIEQVVDDAWITYRVSRNLLAGGHLVYNIGDQVEGITNLLWAIAISCAAFVTRLEIPQASLFLTGLCVVIMCQRIMTLGRDVTGSWVIGSVAACSLILTPDMWRIQIMGLEAPLYCVLQIEFFIRVYRKQLDLAALMSVLLFMTRPEGLMFGLIVCASWLIGDRDAKRLWRVIGIVVIGVGSVEIFRYLYYGSVVPNSVIAKSIPMDIVLRRWRTTATYCMGFIQMNGQWIVVMFAGAIAAMCRRRHYTDEFRLSLAALACIAASFVVVFRNTGDWMNGHRLLMQYGPAYVSLLIVSAKAMRTPHAIVWSVLFMTCLSMSYDLMNRRERIGLLTILPKRYFYTEVVRRLEDSLDVDDVVASEVLGYCGYMLKDNTMHDPMGLIDEHIAMTGSSLPQYGKRKPNYTFGVVRPAIMIWQRTGMLDQVNKVFLKEYIGLCYVACNTPNAHFVLIRRDRIDQYRPLFAGWAPLNYPGLLRPSDL